MTYPLEEFHCVCVEYGRFFRRSFKNYEDMNQWLCEGQRGSCEGNFLRIEDGDLITTYLHHADALNLQNGRVVLFEREGFMTLFKKKNN